MVYLVGILGFGQSDCDFQIGQEYSIKSKVLGEERQVIVGLPQNYNPKDKTYSVIVLLDGDYHFISTYGNIEYLSKRFLIPESILIAIPNTNRVRDLTPTKTKINFNGEEDNSLSESGGASNFLKFLENELLPWAAERFSTNNLETIIGHSWGGLVVTEAFLNKETQFDTFLAIDPSYWWDNQVLTKRIKMSSENTISEHKKLYISSSSLKVEKESGQCCRQRNSVDLFYATLKEAFNNNDKIALQYFEDEDHASIPVPSAYYGLKFLFCDYVMNKVYDKSFVEIKAHFLKYYSRLNKEVKIPEDLVRNVAQYKLYAKDQVDEALTFYRYNVENYPNSIRANQNICEAYKKVGPGNLGQRFCDAAHRLQNETK